MKMKITLSGTWEGFEGIVDQAAEGDADYLALQQCIERATWRKAGQWGQLMALELDSVDALRALVKEARYQNEYWNDRSDPYGIREGGSYCANRARAAKVVLQRAEALLAEVKA